MKKRRHLSVTFLLLLLFSDWSSAKDVIFHCSGVGGNGRSRAVIVAVVVVDFASSAVTFYVKLNVFVEC